MLYLFMILNLLFSFYLLSEVMDLNKKVIRLIQENAIQAFLLENKNSDRVSDDKNNGKEK